MGLPTIDIIFKTKAASAIARSQKGVVALIVRESKKSGPLVLTDVTQVPSTIGVENQSYIKRAFVGYVNQPRQVLVYIMPSASTDFTEALAWLATQSFDYLAAPPDVTESECGDLAAWIKSRRQNDKAICKAVLPNTAADSEAVVNFVAEDIKVGKDTFTAAQYSSRVAGLLAGTPMDISCSFAALPEVEDIKRMTRVEMDAAIDAGKYIVLHDGEKVKVGRGVNSLQTTTADKGEIYKKIKLVEAMDMIQTDIRLACQDGYIGKRPNSYDDKCLLMTAIKGYLAELERGGILKAGGSSVGIDLKEQRVYLQSVGVDVSKLSEQDIKEYDTADKVFLVAQVKILDAIEDIRLLVEL